MVARMEPTQVQVQDFVDDDCRTCVARSAVAVAGEQILVCDKFWRAAGTADDRRRQPADARPG